MSRAVALTPDQMRGRRITVAIALLVAVPPVVMTTLVALLLPGSLSTTSWIQLALPLALAFLLYKGYGWARGWAIFTLTIGGAWMIAAPLLAGNVPAAAIAFPFAAAQLAAAIVLWRSASVEAYFDRQAEARDRLPSLRDL